MRRQRGARGSAVRSGPPGRARRSRRRGLGARARSKRSIRCDPDAIVDRPPRPRRRAGRRRGLLLPQVATEWGWDARAVSGADLPQGRTADGRLAARRAASTASRPTSSADCISRRSIVQVRRSSGSTSLGARLCGVSTFGVSSSIGSARNRGSLSRRRNGSRPRQPLPMCSCRSTRLPHGFFESFR